MEASRRGACWRARAAFIGWQRLACWLGWLLASSIACDSVKTPAQIVPARVERIGSQTVLSDEILWNLGPSVRRRVVAVSTLSDDVRYSLVANAWPASVPRVPGTSEGLVARRPDVVFVGDFTAGETLALLSRAGIPVHTLHGLSRVDDYRRHVRDIGRAVGATREAERLVTTFDAQFAARPQPPSAARPTILSWADGSVAGSNTTFDEIAKAAGFNPLAASVGVTGHRLVALEQLVVWDPDMLVVPCGSATCSDAQRLAREQPGLQTLRATNSGHLLAVPSRELYATGEGMLALLERLSRARLQFE